LAEQNVYHPLRFVVRIFFTRSHGFRRLTLHSFCIGWLGPSRGKKILTFAPVAPGTFTFQRLMPLFSCVTSQARLGSRGSLYGLQCCLPRLPFALFFRNPRGFSRFHSLRFVFITPPVACFNVFPNLRGAVGACNPPRLLAKSVNPMGRVPQTTKDRPTVFARRQRLFSPPREHFGIRPVASIPVCTVLHAVPHCGRSSQAHPFSSHL